MRIQRVASPVFRVMIAVVRAVKNGMGQLAPLWFLLVRPTLTVPRRYVLAFKFLAHLAIACQDIS